MEAAGLNGVFWGPKVDFLSKRFKMERPRRKLSSNIWPKTTNYNQLVHAKDQTMHTAYVV